MPVFHPADAPVYVTVEYRGAGDPRFPVPTQLRCPDCPGVANLAPYIVGYGYDCPRCGAQVPIQVISTALPTACEQVAE